MSVEAYIHNLTNRVYKLLTLREKEMCGMPVFCDDYIDSLCVDMVGATVTFPMLCTDTDYMIVVNIIQYLKANETTYKAYKREIFKALHLLNDIEARCGGAK